MRAGSQIITLTMHFSHSLTLERQHALSRSLIHQVQQGLHSLGGAAITTKGGHHTTHKISEATHLCKTCFSSLAAQRAIVLVLLTLDLLPSVTNLLSIIAEGSTTGQRAAPKVVQRSLHMVKPITPRHQDCNSTYPNSPKALEILVSDLSSSLLMFTTNISIAPTAFSTSWDTSSANILVINMQVIQHRPLTWNVIVSRFEPLYDASVGLQTAISQLVAVVYHVIVVLVHLQLCCLLQHL